MTHVLENIQSLFLRNERVSAASIGALMLMAVVVMGVISLALLNDKATKGYLLNQLEEERNELTVDLEVTDMLILRARSVQEIESQVPYMMKPTRDEVVYVTPITVVAQAE